MEETSTLVQEKIKRMLESKRRLTKKDSSGKMPNLEQEDSVRPKQRISSAARLRSNSVKNVESMEQIPDYKTEVNVTALLESVFEHSPKVRDFMKNNGISHFEWLEKLAKNEVFVLSLQGKLGKINPERHAERTEKQILSRIQKIIARESQEKQCLETELKITALLDNRLMELKVYK